MRVVLELDRETACRLVQAAVRERRPVRWQADIMLRRALGLPFPAEADESANGRGGVVRHA